MPRKIITAIVLSLALTAPTALAHDVDPASLPPWQAATDWPDRIVTTLTHDPATSFAVTWRTDNSVANTIAEITEATPDSRFDINASAVQAESKALDPAHFITPEGILDYLGNQTVGITHHHHVVFEGLKPNTLYAFRVQGANGNWSEWFQYRTAGRKGPISFVYMGDAQMGVRTHWARVIRMAAQTAPLARFFLHAGDLVQNGPSDRDWGGWFNAGGFLHAQIATLPIIGNHDHMSVDKPDGSNGGRVPTPFWRAQFTLPDEKDLPEELRELVYDIRYSDDLEVFAMDSTPSHYNMHEGGYEAQAKWLAEHLKKSAARWKIVAMHHPYFVSGLYGGRRDPEEKAMRDAYESVIAQGGVDLVFTGHIHYYNRSSTPTGKMIDAPVDVPDDAPGATGGRAMTGNPRDVGTMFMISAATVGTGDVPPFTPDYVDKNVGDAKPDLGKLSVDRVAENTPMFQVIDIDGSKLSLRAYMATGDIYDAFTLEKVDNGKRTILTDGPSAHGDTRLFERNTGPFKEWYDLQ